MSTKMSPLSESKDAAAALVGSGHGCLLVDFDGTVSEIVDEPGNARLFPGVVDTLDHLSGHCEVAVISGRSVSWLRNEVGSPNLSYVGIHGAQVAGGRETVIDRTGTLYRSALAAVKADVTQWLGSEAREHGISLEDKGSSLALHYRQAPDTSSAYRLIRGLLSTRELPGVLEVHDGRMVVELRPAGFDKGRVVRDMVAEVRPDWLIYAGDDRTDADAFLAAKVLRDGGVVDTLTIGVFSDEWPADAVCSPDYWAASVREFADWLAWLENKSSS